MDQVKDPSHKPWIETARTAERLRSRIIDLNRRCILIARIANSAQAPDLTVPANCGGFGRIRHFRRVTATNWPSNPLPIDPAARALNLENMDILRVQAFQNAGCAWRCWYCFVPFEMLAGNVKLGAWMSADELVELYLAEASRPLVIDLTGGSPDLSPEWVLWMMRALRSRGLERSTYLWSDDNLSTDFLWRYLQSSELREIVEYPSYGRVACFKGFDEASFTFNTHANPQDYAIQFELMRRLIKEKIDCYAYATFTAETGRNVDAAMRTFVDRLQSIHCNLPLRTVPLRIEPFSPVEARLNDARRKALLVQDSAIAAWNEEMARRFTPIERASRIDEVVLG